MPNRIEEIASKGMGKVKEAKAALRGLKGVFMTISEQHGEVTALLYRAKISSDVSKTRELWRTIRRELLAHERAELEEVYPVLRSYEATRAIAEKHEGDAGLLKGIIDRLDATIILSNQWNELFEELMLAVKHHALEEEDRTFPNVQTVIGEVRAKQIDPRFIAAYKRHLLDC